MSKLLIKFPTRSRPEKFKEVLQKHIDFLSGNHDVRFVITMDDDDETCNTSEMRDWMDSLGVDLKYNFGQSKTKIEACNADMDGESADVMLLTSDDMIPTTKGYDDIIFSGFKEYFPDFDGAIKFYDGLRPPNDALMTLPIIGRKLYEAMGNFYYPGYESLYADNDTTHICAMLNKFVVSQMCIIKHEWVQGDHPDADELHQLQESPEMYQKDLEVFNSRKANNFNIETIRNRLNPQMPI
jgi:hypothetical protein